MFSFYRMNTQTKLLRIGTQQYSPYIYCRFQTVFSPQIIILNFISQLKTYTKRRLSSKKPNLKHKCVLQESCQTVRRCSRDLFCLSREVTAQEIDKLGLLLHFYQTLIKGCAFINAYIARTVTGKFLLGPAIFMIVSVRLADCFRVNT